MTSSTVGIAQDGLHYEAARIAATGQSSREGLLIRWNGVLVAIICRIEDDVGGPLSGQWFLEAGFGPCVIGSERIYSSPEKAGDWVLGCHSSLASN